MPEDVFGSPNAKDDVAEDEKVIESAAREQAQMLEEILSRRGRTPGSKPVPKAQESAEWEIMREDASHAATFFQDQNMTIEKAINYAWNAEHRRRQ